jgi:hypothetical protein
MKYFDVAKASSELSFSILAGQTKTRVIPESQEVIVYGQALWGERIVFDLLRAGETKVCIDIYGM